MSNELCFGISTHIYYSQRLNHEHLEELRREPFSHLELFCAQHHFDFRDGKQVEDVAGGLQRTGFRINSLHSPFYTLRPSGERAYYSISSIDEDERQHALAEIKAAMALRATISYDFVVVHLGPTGERHRRDDRAQCLRSLSELSEHCLKLGVALAVENIPNSFSTTDALARLGEEMPDLSFCFDSGHANMEGDPKRTIQSLGTRIRTTHLHDNGGSSDEHRVPYDGTVPWNSVMGALRSQSYQGVYVLEVREAPEQPDFVTSVQSAARRMAAEL